MEMVMNAWVAQGISAAADLGIADALANGPLSVKDLAVAVEADANTLHRLLRALTSRGIFRLRRDGRYELTALAEPLRRDAKISVAAAARWMGSPVSREHWTLLTDCVRSGRDVATEIRGQTFFDYVAGQPEIQDSFNQAMSCFSEVAIAPIISVYDFSRYSTIVDVGGGQGRLLAAILTETPHARGVLFDLPHVVADAPAELRRDGVAGRVDVVEGCFFDDEIPAGDLYVLKNVIHDWPDAAAVRILSNVRASARTGAHVLLAELVIPRHDRDFAGKWLDLEMLACVDGRERTAGEYRGLLSAAGFRMTRVVQTVSPLSIVEAVAI
jgi:DNA-binding transcriptional ArsR family regulator/SAM-dependent methyltransferase